MPTRTRHTNTQGFRNGRFFSSTYTTNTTSNTGGDGAIGALLILLSVIAGLVWLAKQVWRFVELAWHYLQDVWTSHPIIAEPAAFTLLLWKEILHFTIGVPYGWVFEPAITTHRGLNILIFTASELTLFVLLILALRRTLAASGQHRNLVISSLVLILLGPLLFSIAALGLLLIFFLGKWLLW